MNDLLLGFDIGGTKCAVVLGETTADGVRILERVAFATEPARGPEPVLQRLETEARRLMAAGNVRALGISCGNPLDSTRGMILSPPNLPGWDEIPITARFAAALGIPARLQNDANACALAEWRWGAGRGSRHMVFLTFGTGFGAGLILNGQLYAGANDNAGEIGHVRLEHRGPIGYGKHGSCEGFCSGGGIARLGRQIIRKQWRKGIQVPCCPDRAALDGLTAQTIFTAARAGDPTALEIVTRVARQLGRSLAMLIDLFNPEIIVIGSIFVRANDLLWPIAQRVIAEEALPPAAAICRVVPAVLGEQLGDYACLSIAASILDGK